MHDREYRSKNNNCLKLQLRIDFLDFSLAQPNGTGYCDLDFLIISRGSSTVPRLCGENADQHGTMEKIEFLRRSESIYDSCFSLRRFQWRYSNHIVHWYEKWLCIWPAMETEDSANRMRCSVAWYCHIIQKWSSNTLRVKSIFLYSSTKWLSSVLYISNWQCHEFQLWNNCE